MEAEEVEDNGRRMTSFRGVFAVHCVGLAPRSAARDSASGVVADRLDGGAKRCCGVAKRCCDSEGATRRASAVLTVAVRNALELPIWACRCGCAPIGCRATPDCCSVDSESRTATTSQSKGRLIFASRSRNLVGLSNSVDQEYSTLSTWTSWLNPCCYGIAWTSTNRKCFVCTPSLWKIPRLSSASFVSSGASTLGSRS